MAYTVKLGNITEMECDVIVNSLGINGSVYGMLCESIINAANSAEIKNFIDSKTNNPVGFIYETEAGDLPCKKLFHIVTPHKFMDDENNQLLRKAYQDIIDKAINMGFKSIALPFIGTGANGYAETEVYNIVVDICGELSVLEEVEDRDILDISIVSFLKPKKVRSKHKNHINRYDRESEYYDQILYYEASSKFNCCEAPISIAGDCNFAFSELQANVLKCAEFMASFNPEEYIPSNYDYYMYPYDFVDDYSKYTQISTLAINDDGMDRKYKSKLKRGEVPMKKATLYSIAYSMKMNPSNLIQFMLASGFSFSPSDKLDIFMIDFMNGKYGKFDTFWDWVDECYKVTGIHIPSEYSKSNK